MRLTRLCVLALAALLAVFMTGCALDGAIDTLRRAFSANEAAATPAAASAVCTPSPSPAPTPPPYSESDALAAAELYRDVYERLFTGEQIGFSAGIEGTSAIVDRLEQSGLSAFSPEGVPMTNTEQIYRFMSDADIGRSAAVAIYEICDDAGFLCHYLALRDGAATVTLTRLAWLDGGELYLQGSIPTVTYSKTYKLTAIHFEGDTLCYSYYMPDNPAGTNHDGHVDTDVSIPLE